jgi:5-methylcytosine-specific restriction endonuclease McrA
MLHTSICFVCSKPFARSRPVRGITCSSECRGILRQKKKSIKICKGCSKSYIQPKGPETNYCSIQCFNKSRRGTTKSNMYLKCKQCGQVFKRHAGASHQKFCSTTCYNKSRYKPKLPKGRHGSPPGPLSPNWKGGISRRFYRMYLKEKCERCGSGQFVLVHHIDEDRKNNQPSNLETLCKRCHQKHHETSRDSHGRYTS